jgi:uncharacterized protein
MYLRTVYLKGSLWVVAVILLTVTLSACITNKNRPEMDTSIAFRLKPGEDLIGGIEKIVKEKNIQAGWIQTCVGSLTNYNIRMANQPDGSKGSGHFEIVSLVGTLSVNGSHIHISLSDSTGKTIGGHLLEGCKVYTTAEIVLGQNDRMVFTREKDGTTEWEELQVKQKEN